MDEDMMRRRGLGEDEVRMTDLALVRGEEVRDDAKGDGEEEDKAEDLLRGMSDEHRDMS